MILMTVTFKKYPAPLTLTTLMCLVGTLLAAIMTAILDHKASSWRLSWNISLLAPIYIEVLVFGIVIYLQLLIIRKKGPVFMTAFRPLSTLLVNIMGLIIFRDALHLGRKMEGQDERKVVERGRSKMKMVVENLQPYILCIFCNILLAGFNIVSKVSLDDGMSRYVLVTYGYAIATFTTAILAFLFERNNKSKINVVVLRDVFFLSFLGAVLGRTLFFAGLESTSPAFAAAMINLIPSLTFILAIIFRMEKLDITKTNGQAKILGTIIAFAGATLMTLYKGIVVISIGSRHWHQSTTSKSSFDVNWIKGSLFLFIAFLSLAAFYILQTTTFKKYPAPLTLTTLTCLVATLLAAIMTAILDHKASSWKLSWNISLLAPIYSGVMVYGIVIYLQLLVIRRKGPVFMTAFRPLSTLLVAIMGLFIFGDALHLGSIVGGTLIIIGLYTMLWGKENEKKKSQLMERTVPEQKQRPDTEP